MQILVAMSGGVDSSVAAALLVEAGHEVVGVTMKLWRGASDTGCCSVADVDDARRVAQQLRIDHAVFNFSDDFDRHVIDPYVEAHRSGVTPNPCIECNRHLKFDRLWERAAQLGFDAVATGHHCRIASDAGRMFVHRGADRAKDQSYVVHMLEADRLGGVHFPVGHLTKTQVRAEAARLGLRTAHKPDSQDVCFISSDGGRRTFLGSRIALRPGTVVDTSGHAIGSVDAVELVTIGQRRGLDLGGSPERRFALSVDTALGVVVAGTSDELSLLVSPVVGVRFVHEPAREVLVQSSAHGAPAAATIEGDMIRWVDPHRRIAPGQSVVFYDPSDSRVLGSATAA